MKLGWLIRGSFMATSFTQCSLRRFENRSTIVSCVIVYTLVNRYWIYNYHVCKHRLVGNWNLTICKHCEILCMPLSFVGHKRQTKQYMLIKWATGHRQGKYLLRWQALSCLTRFRASTVILAVIIQYRLMEITPLFGRQGFVNRS